MSDERVWLKHGEHGGFFPCPAGAVADFEEHGWQRTDERPEEFNPVVAEALAAQRAAAEANAAATGDEPAAEQTEPIDETPATPGTENEE